MFGIKHVHFDSVLFYALILEGDQIVSFFDAYLVNTCLALDTAISAFAWLELLL